MFGGKEKERGRERKGKCEGERREERIDNQYVRDGNKQKLREKKDTYLYFFYWLCREAR